LTFKEKGTLQSQPFLKSLESKADLEGIKKSSRKRALLFGTSSFLLFNFQGNAAL
jgi:hypothetical protein